MINTTISKQLEIIRQLSKEKISLIYQQEFYLKLIAVMIIDKKWFEDNLRCIDILSRLIETSVVGTNPRRALRYYCVLNSAMRELVEHVDTVFSSRLEQQLLNYKV